jgi:hypothetical protein
MGSVMSSADDAMLARLGLGLGLEDGVVRINLYVTDSARSLSVSFALRNEMAMQLCVTLVCIIVSWVNKCVINTPTCGSDD